MNNVYIIAEAAQGYEGSVEVSKLLIRSAKIAKANAIKFQVVYADDLAEVGYQYYDLFRSLEMTDDQWLSIRNFALEQKVDFVIDIFGEQSYKLAQKMKPEGVKIHSTCFFDDALIEKILALDCYVYLSVGGIFFEEIKERIEKYNLSQKNNFAILYGFQAEPTPLSSNNLLRIPQIREQLGIRNVGFMDHSHGQGRHTTTLSSVALGLGVKIFEKHITLDYALEMEDFVSALAVSDFSSYVNDLCELNEALGIADLTLTPEEIAYRNKAIKRVVAKRDLDSGEVISLEHVRLNRPQKMEGAFKLSDVVGQKLVKSVSAGSGITKEFVVNE